MSLIKAIWNGLDSRLDKQQYFKWFNYLAIIILVGEAVLNAAIIKRVPCTPISSAALQSQLAKTLLNFFLFRFPPIASL
jgi:hypothetical protein